jgi:hypothetical protein
MSGLNYERLLNSMKITSNAKSLYVAFEFAGGTCWNCFHPRLVSRIHTLHYIKKLKIYSCATLDILCFQYYTPFLKFVQSITSHGF